MESGSQSIGKVARIRCEITQILATHDEQSPMAAAAQQGTQLPKETVFSRHIDGVERERLFELVKDQDHVLLSVVLLDYGLGLAVLQIRQQRAAGQLILTQLENRQTCIFPLFIDQGDPFQAED